MPTLPRELVSLVHHVQLNQTGWWDAAVERLVLAAAWRARSPLHRDAISEAVATHYGARLPAPTVRTCVERLVSRQQLLVLPDQRIKLPEARIAEFDQMCVEGEQREAHVREKFARALAEVGCDCDPEATWTTFHDRWLQPTVSLAGARTYELATGAPDGWMEVGDLDVFTDALPEEQRPAARQAVGRFFDPGDPVLRSYLLSLMDAYFVVEAGALSGETIAAIGAMTRERPAFVVFTDTNTIFSVLGLHGATAKEAAAGVLRVAEEVSAKGVQVKLYVLAQTLDEARGVLQRELEELRKLRVMPKMVPALLATGHLSGVPAAYLEAVAAAGKPIRADDFLGPYVSDLRAILRTHGIELYNDPLTGLAEREAVVADIEEQVQFEKDRRAARPKPRGAIRHDVMLWHFAHGKRPSRVESPTDAHYWVLTEDYRFISYDAYKRRRAGVPVCLHPLAFAQVLEFWNGRTEGTAAALVGGLRLAMLTPRLDVEAERTTLAIIAAISRFQDVGDLPSETVAHLLVNDALRQKLERAPDAEAEFDLVRDEIVAEHQRAVEEGEQVRAHASDLERRVADGERARQESEDRARATAAERDATQAELEATRRASAEKDARILGLEEASRAADARERGMEEKLEDVARRLEAREQADQRARVAAERREVRRDFALRWLLVPAGVLIVIGWVLFKLPALNGTFLGDPRVGAAVVAVLTAIWAAVAHRRARRNDASREWWVARVLQVTSYGLGAIGGLGLGVGIVGNALYDRSGLRPAQEAPPIGQMRRSVDTVPDSARQPPTGPAAAPGGSTPGTSSDSATLRAPGGPGTL